MRVPIRTGAGVALVGLILALAAALAGAQESPAQWLARIFDPATLTIDSFPGAALNRKLSVDAIALERGGPKRIAIYTIPLGQVKAAATHFEQQLGIRPQVVSPDSPFETFVFDGNSAGAPARLQGLRVNVSRSQFVDNKGQITMEYLPPTP